jgi:hypothetical protein
MGVYCAVTAMEGWTPRAGSSMQPKPGWSQAMVRVACEIKRKVNTLIRYLNATALYMNSPFILDSLVPCDSFRAKGSRVLSSSLSSQEEK